MNLPPKQMKRQVLQRVTTAPAEEARNEALQPEPQPSAAAPKTSPAPEAHQVKQVPWKDNTQEEMTDQTAKMHQKASKAFTNMRASDAPEPKNTVHTNAEQGIKHDKFRPQATPAAPMGKLKRGPQLPKAAQTAKQPPMTPTQHLPRRAATKQEDSSSALRRRLDAGIQGSPESLPVLHAFQEFLDIERKRSRRHITVLAACFTVILALVILAGALGAMVFIKPLKDEYVAMSETLKSDKADARELREYIQSSLVQINKDMQKEKAALTSTKDSMALLTGTYDETINDLKSIIETLNKENSTLKRDVVAMRNDLPALNRELNRALEEIAELRADFHPAPELHKQYSSKPYVTVSVKPEGLQRNINLRIPIEE